MDKYDRHLEFLIQVLPNQSVATCQDFFLATCKRDVCKALFFLLQPTESSEILLEKFLQTNNKESELQIKLLDAMLHWYCPNPSFTKIVTQVSKGIPIKIDSATITRLKKFRRVPPKQMLFQWFELLNNTTDSVILYLLTGLRVFDWSLEPCWTYIDYYANSTNLEVLKAALTLLAKMPQGILKSVATLDKHLKNSKTRFYALTAMQQTTSIPPTLLTNLLSPIINDYQRLVYTKGQMNDLWQEFRLVQNIAKNNGLVLSIPNISLERF